MKKFVSILLMIALAALAACSNTDEESANHSDATENKDETIVFGQTSWTSTEAPTQIAKQILEEAGYDVEIKLLSQPVIFEGLQSKEVDIFMDAWLPYTEAELWNEYQDDVQKIATSYENVPLGWVVPTYVEEDSIEDIKENPEKFGNEVYTISPGAGVVSISEEVMADYNLDAFELMPSSETAMISTLDQKINNEEPVIITGWRPHSIFEKYDLKFLEEPKENFKYDNVYVVGYKGLEEDHPKAYEVLSKWSIEVGDLEKMIHDYENNDVPFEESAAQWIEEHRDKVDDMLGK
ncbi:glycine betaine/proline transport system substrate-binding protein [Lentibacillus halodurans]|uniref:Glycine betaine/proline transport system substrate-binding protein n=1 Tax=Lentibacillus halodurans TaxID=237679 RepID=A0A1I1A480_9BACI|nr:glycine betaine ABC transporter substrate-binding protein [Lentibacillus halodurans]SFB32769.1 glycine betaine/proline transport system substrate-binding protein [Lentibacillus halodurans]